MYSIANFWSIAGIKSISLSQFQMWMQSRNLDATKKRSIESWQFLINKYKEEC